MNGCPTCEREGHRPHKNGQPNRCPEAKARAVATQVRFQRAHRELVNERNRPYRNKWNNSNKGYRSKRLWQLARARERTVQQLRDLTGERG